MVMKVLTTKQVKYTMQSQTYQSLIFYLEVKLAIENLKNHKAPVVDHIPSELIQADGGK